MTYKQIRVKNKIITLDFQKYLPTRNYFKCKYIERLKVKMIENTKQRTLF